jgi:hypothetical protein
MRPRLEPDAGQAYLTPMPLLRPLVLILMAMVFAVGGLARAAEAPTTAPPCHEMPADPSSKATLAISCCIGCMPAQSLLPAPLSVTVIEAPAIYAASSPTLLSRPLAPDTPPPRA